MCVRVHARSPSQWTELGNRYFLKYHKPRSGLLLVFLHSILVSSSPIVRAPVPTNFNTFTRFLRNNATKPLPTTNVLSAGQDLFAILFARRIDLSEGAQVTMGTMFKNHSDYFFLCGCAIN